MNIFKNKYFILGIMLLLLITIPVILYFVKHQTQTGTHAAATTQLSLTASGSATINASVGTPFTVTITVNPNQNIVSIVDMYILFDQTKLQLTSIAPNTTAFPTTLRGPVIGSGSGNISVNIGANVTNAIQTPTTVATLTFTPLATTPTGGTQISFDPTQSRVFSLAQTDQPGENVLQSTNPVVVNIGTGSTTTPTPTPTATAGTVTPVPTTASAPPAPASSNNTAPVCNSLSVDRSTTGAAPYSILFTGNATGTNPIEKATFSYGDGNQDNVTSAGGIGTDNVNIQVAHTYNNPGLFTATVNFTDSNSLVSSASASCSQVITVNAAAASSGGSTGGGTQPGGSTPRPTIPATGDTTGTVAAIGGIIITIAGGAALLLL